MSADPLEPLRREFAELADRLETPCSAAERETVKAGIIALFHRTERQLDELTAFKESIRDLISRYKALPPVAGAAPVPGPMRSAPASVRHDHVGASTYVERGWSAIASRRWTDAEAHLRRAIELDGTGSGARALLGWVLMARDELAAGRAQCEMVLSEVPDHAMAQAVLGAIRVREGDEAMGIAFLEQAARQGAEPRAALYAHYWLGRTLLARGAGALAEQSLRQAMALGPNLAEGWLTLGQVLWEQGRRSEASEAWLRGARIRHSTFAPVCQQSLDIVAAGGEPTRSPLW